MNTFSVGECITFGWETFKKRPWFLMGIILGVLVVSVILSSIDDQKGLIAVPIFLAVLAANILIEMGLVTLVLKAHDNLETVSFETLWNPAQFWHYLGAKILQSIIIVIGVILLVIPGIIAALVLFFTNYVVIDRGLAPVAALKESARITKGHRWNLFLLLLAVIVMNIVGALAFGVGLLVSIPVSLFAMVHAYRKLEHSASEVVSVSPIA